MQSFTLQQVLLINRALSAIYPQEIGPDTFEDQWLVDDISHPDKEIYFYRDGRIAGELDFSSDKLIFRSCEHQSVLSIPKEDFYSWRPL